MKNKALVLAVATIMFLGVASFAFSAGVTCSGKVTKVKGNMVTIELERGKAADISVGDSVKVEIEKAEEAEAGGFEMLEGC